nr:MAG TPA: hypothetical protein [Bacteriophage sp.]
MSTGCHYLYFCEPIQKICYTSLDLQRLLINPVPRSCDVGYRQ